MARNGHCVSVEKDPEKAVPENLRGTIGTGHCAGYDISESSICPAGCRRTCKSYWGTYNQIRNFFMCLMTRHLVYTEKCLPIQYAC